MKKVQKIKWWGNSLAVRIPASVAKEAGLTKDQQVDVRIEDGALVVRLRPPHEIRDWG